MTVRDSLVIKDTSSRGSEDFLERLPPLTFTLIAKALYPWLDSLKKSKEVFLVCLKIVLNTTM